MSDSGEPNQNKRPRDDDTDDTDTMDMDSTESDNFVFVRPVSKRAPLKKRKLIPSETLLESLPCGQSYENCYTHSDTVTHCLVTVRDIIVTASCDGYIKFWKKVETGIEFVKHFQIHADPIVEIACNRDGTLLCSASLDKSLKIFDVSKLDVINVLKLDYIPGTVEWIHNSGDRIHSLAVSDKNSYMIYIYNGRSNGKHLSVLYNIHHYPVSLIKYNPKYDIIISADKKGSLEYWTSNKQHYIFPRNIGFHSKLYTDLYEFVKKKTFPCSLAFSPDGKTFATISMDRKVRVFNFFTGKLIRVLDESMPRITKHQQVFNMVFDSRMAMERELEKSESFELSNIIFDDSGYIVMYATSSGIKMINIHTNKCVRIVGKEVNLRMLNIALFQGSARDSCTDPTLICTAYKKSRFYLFSRREPNKLQGDQYRDVINDIPSDEENFSARDISDRRP